MRHTFKIATLNINGIASKTRLGMLEEFLKRQDIDFALLQEVTKTNQNTFRNYTSHTNEGKDRRGTAIVAKEGLELSDIKRLPSGRGMAAKCNGIWMISTGRIYPHTGNIPSAYFCWRLSQTQGHSSAVSIRSIKNSKDTIKNRTREIPVCDAVSQPIRHCVSPP
jgi:exonuclease III